MRPFQRMAFDGEGHPLLVWPTREAYIPRCPHRAVARPAPISAPTLEEIVRRPAFLLGRDCPADSYLVQFRDENKTIHL